MVSYAKLFVAVIMWLLAGSVLVVAGQEVTYKTTRDNPQDICNFWLYLDPFQLDAPVQNSYGLSINSGIWTMGIKNNRFGGEATARYGFLTPAKAVYADTRAALHVEAGGLLIYRDVSVSKNATRVVLKEDRKDNGNGSETVTTVSIDIPAIKRNIAFIRGGFFCHRSPYKGYIDEYTSFRGDISAYGIYVGLGKLGVYNVFINTDRYGKAYRSGAFRTYMDLIIAPVRSITAYSGVTLPATVKPKGPLGFRFGFYNLPVELRNMVRKGWSAGVEGGFRPGEGFYVAGTMMFPLARRKAKWLGYVAPLDTNDKGQKIEKE
ncbi:MAG: hypothetical protein RLZZ46_879 [Bacteroidota bacterium]